jgi:hypothetical protein
MEQRITVRLPRNLLSSAKCKAAAENRTLASIIADGLRMVLADGHRPTRAKRILPRVSNASGGLLPGIAIADSRSLQESDDLDYMLRLTRSK